VQPLRPFILFALAVAAGLALAAVGRAAAPAFDGPVEAGKIEGSARRETSGLAASGRNPGLLWLHDDSGNPPLLHAIEPNGNPVGTLQVGGVKNTDWEDLAAVTLDGKPWLVVGDVGDNDAVRRSVLIHFVAEPDRAALAAAGRLAEQPAATLTVTYEDGPRDVESLAVDPRERAIYLLSKRDDVPRLYRIALPAGPPVSAAVSARFVGTVPHLPKASAGQLLLNARLGRMRGWPCALDFAPDGSAAVVLTYGDTLVFPRAAGETWAKALARPPVRLAQHALPQAEAACFSADGKAIFVTSEETKRLLRYDRK
jgi:hypothetical protein